MPKPTVYLVEDDAFVCQSLVELFRKEQFLVEAFASPNDLLNVFDSSFRGCLVLDLLLGPMNGIELQQKLLKMGCTLPFVIISARGDIPDATEAMRLGAIDFLQKPVKPDLLIDRVKRAFAYDERQVKMRAEVNGIKRRIDLLSERENEIMELVVSGHLTKNIASRLGISVKTVEAHRSNITKKMKVKSVVQLVRQVLKYQIAGDSSNRGCCTSRGDI